MEGKAQSDLFFVYANNRVLFVQGSTLMRLSATLLCTFILTSLGYSATIVIPAHYHTIQAGIDAALPGDIVLVEPGTYLENIDFQGKAITVRSKCGSDNTVIDGGSPLDPDFDDGDRRRLSGDRLDRRRTGTADIGSTHRRTHFPALLVASEIHCGVVGGHYDSHDQSGFDAGNDLRYRR